MKPPSSDFLPTEYPALLLGEFIDFLVRCQQCRVAESMNYIAPGVIDRIRRNSANPQILLAKTNRAYRALKAEFPDVHPIWNYIHNYSIPAR